MITITDLLGVSYYFTISFLIKLYEVVCLWKWFGYKSVNISNWSNYVASTKYNDWLKQFKIEFSITVESD